MWYRLQDFDDAFRLLDGFRRDLDRSQEPAAPRASRARAFSGARLEDTGNAFLLSVDLPGVKESDVDLQLENQTLTLTVERRPDAPQGYAVHRQERTPWRLARSFALPARLDAEKVRATLNHGVLTVRVEKAREFQPRKIAVGH